MKMLWVCHLKMPEVPHFSDLGARKIKRMTASDFHLFQATPLQGRSPHLCHTHKGPRRSELWEENPHRRPAGHTCGFCRGKSSRGGTQQQFGRPGMAQHHPMGHAALGLPFPTLETAKKETQMGAHCLNHGPL